MYGPFELLPLEMIEHIYILSDIDTRCTLHKLFGTYFFKSIKVSYPQGLDMHVKQVSNIVNNRHKVLLQLIASITPVV
jgi:hypothetical protein